MEILRLWTYAKSLDLVDWGKMRYNLLGQADHWFPGEHVAKMDYDKICTATPESPFAGEIPNTLKEAHELLIDQEQQRLSNA
jgi:predicted aldo/keto reductase-like oxidoreductase